MSFADWQKKGWLKEHQSRPEEIANLLEIAERDLAACQTPHLVAEWRFNIAYNAALQLATAALAAAGYQATRTAHHYRVVQSLSLTLGLDDDAVELLNTFRAKRNIADYERADVVSDSDVQEIIEVASDLRRQVLDWLRRKYRYLLPE